MKTPDVVTGRSLALLVLGALISAMVSRLARMSGDLAYGIWIGFVIGIAVMALAVYKDWI